MQLLSPGHMLPMLGNFLPKNSADNRCFGAVKAMFSVFDWITVSLDSTRHGCHDPYGRGHAWREKRPDDGDGRTTKCIDYSPTVDLTLFDNNHNGE